MLSDSFREFIIDNVAIPLSNWLSTKYSINISPRDIVNVLYKHNSETGKSKKPKKSTKSAKTTKPDPVKPNPITSIVSPRYNNIYIEVEPGYYKSTPGMFIESKNKFILQQLPDSNIVVIGKLVGDKEVDLDDNDKKIAESMGLLIAIDIAKVN